ncbi:MAG: tetratricopeptide repeat protein [Gammaproteobacteria bacterium]
MYLSDDEQAEAIKKWWKENGRAVVSGIVLGLAVVVGVRYWFQYTHTQAQNASIIYAQIEQALERSDATTVLEQGQVLLNDYGRTTYAVMAAMSMAKVAIAAGKTDQAKDHLQWVVAHADDGLQHTARLRLARLLLEEEKLEQAAGLLTGVKSAGYSAAYEELRADLALAQGNAAQARELYRLALAESSGIKREFLQMKIDNLAVDAPSTQAR